MAQHARDCNAFLFTIKGVEVQAAARKGLTLTVRLRGETERGYQLVKSYDEFKALRDIVQRKTHQWKKFNQRMGDSISTSLGACENCAYCMHFMSSVESNLWLGPLAHVVHSKQHNASQLGAWINYYVLQARVTRGGCKASDCVASLVAEFFRTETERDTILEA